MIKISKRSALLAGGGLVLATTAAVAGSGVGGVFNLGQTNTVNAPTQLQGSTTAQQLRVLNRSTATGAVGVLGQSSRGTGVFGMGRIGVRASAGAAGVNYGVVATTASENGVAGYFQNTSTTTDPFLGTGVRGLAAGTTPALFDFTGYAGGGEFAGPDGVVGVSSGFGGAGVAGFAGEGRTGVFGFSVAADGVGGFFQNASATTDQTKGTGLLGLAAGASASAIPDGILAGGGEFVGPNGVIAVSSGDPSIGSGILAYQGSGRRAILAVGNVQINGSLFKASGSFKIDHPQDPGNKYLSHSFVESPDMMNIYNGNVVTDRSGAAVVELPSYFEALNRDPRYQLTVIGSPGDAYVAKEVSGNAFTIQTEAPGVKVSWQVTGIRRDAYAVAHPIVVEEDKVLAERGRYLHPEEHGQPADLAIHHAQSSSQAAALAPQRRAGGG